MFGRTPPCAIVTPASNFPSSSSFLTARRTCLGMILFFLLSRAAFPANSSTCKQTTNLSNKKRVQISICPRYGKLRKQRKMKQKSNFESNDFCWSVFIFPVEGSITEEMTFSTNREYLKESETISTLVMELLEYQAHARENAKTPAERVLKMIKNYHSFSFFFNLIFLASKQYRWIQNSKLIEKIWRNQKEFLL